MRFTVNRTITIGFLASLAASVSACGGNDGQLGYAKSPPNEFNVVRRAPLIVPPEFNLLPPSEQSSRPITPQGADLARLVVLPNAPLQISNRAELSLLEKASGGKIYGDGIREELDNQTRGTASEKAEIVEQLVSDQSKAE